MFYLNSAKIHDLWSDQKSAKIFDIKRSKSGHPKMQPPIMLCLKAKGVHTAPPGNPYNLIKCLNYIKLSVKKMNKHIKKKMKEKKKEFDYYIYIDYSENLIGYSIIESSKIRELLPKISKLKHYKEVKYKREYHRSITRIFEKNNLLNYFIKTKIREIQQNIEIFMDVGEFIKLHLNCLIFVSVDNKQYSNFEKFVKIINGENIKVKKESELREFSPEYKISLVLDNLLNIERIKNDKNRHN